MKNYILILFTIFISAFYAQELDNLSLVLGLIKMNEIENSQADKNLTQI